MSTMDLGAMLQDALQVVPEITAAMREAAPVATGDGAASIQATVSMGGGRSARVSFTGMKHLQYVLEGTAPHLIEPRQTGGVLVFLGTDGNLTFARRVSHPGQHANPFIRRAWDSVQGSVSAQVRAAGLRMFRELARTWYR